MAVLLLCVEYQTDSLLPFNAWTLGSVKLDTKERCLHSALRLGSHSLTAAVSPCAWEPLPAELLASLRRALRHAYLPTISSGWSDRLALCTSMEHF